MFHHCHRLHYISQTLTTIVRAPIRGCLALSDETLPDKSLKHLSSQKEIIVNTLTKEEAMEAFRHGNNEAKTLLNQLELRMPDLEPSEILTHARHLVQIREELKARLIRLQMGLPALDVLDNNPPPSV